MDQTLTNLMLFGTSDLDFDPMTLILKLDLDMVVTYLNKVKVKGLTSYGLEMHTDRRTTTDGQTHRHTQTV